MVLSKLKRELLRVWSQVRKVALRTRLGMRWGDTDGPLARRIYPDYATYLTHQRLKLDALRARSLAGHDQRFSVALSDRLASCPISFEGRSVLCLGARLGTEVRVFVELGAFAVGIDLNPGRHSSWVVEGDFHDLQFADSSVDTVYVNSLDHVFELDRALREAHRVLKPGGVFLVEVGLGTKEGGHPGFYEALSWRTVDELIDRIVVAGFELQRRISFEVPWKGEQALLRKRALA